MTRMDWLGVGTVFGGFAIVVWFAAMCFVVFGPADRDHRKK